MPDEKTPILIVGGGVGGVAAALAIANNGGRCIVTEPTDWIGGQFTAQGVPPDENQWIDGKDGVVGGTKSYLFLREGVRQWYRDHRPNLTQAARNNRKLDPGRSWVSRLTAEPRIWHEVMTAQLEPHIAAGRIAIRFYHEPVAADVAGDRITAVTFSDTRSGERRTITADYFLDATELGDLYPLAKVEYNVGSEHRDVHGEAHGRADKSDPMDQQGISWCFAMEHEPGADHRIAKPDGYDAWKVWSPPTDPPWPGPLFSWTFPAHTGEPRTLNMVPWPDEPEGGKSEFWRYRRIVCHDLYEDDPAAPAPPDVSLVNWPQMDYFRRPTLDVSPAEQQRAFAEARQQSLCFFYWLQNDAPRHDSDTQTGYHGLKLRGEELGTADGFAKTPYIRESRRLDARTIVTEAHVGVDQRRREQPDAVDANVPGGVRTHPWPDSVGIGHYTLDLHPSTAMRHEIFVRSTPFRIPMGALIAKRVRNVLAAGKALGVTHIANGCYRLHPVEWNIGESAGLLALHAITEGHEPRAVHENIDRVRAFQKVLVDQGVRLSWPWEKRAGLD